MLGQSYNDCVVGVFCVSQSHDMACHIITLKFKKIISYNSQYKMASLDLLVFFSLFSGVSVNVQDLAPSCAGALFGNVYILYLYIIQQWINAFWWLLKWYLYLCQLQSFFEMYEYFVILSTQQFYICICIFHAGVMNTCGAFSGETRIMYLWFIFWNYMSVHTPQNIQTPWKNKLQIIGWRLVPYEPHQARHM